MVDREDMNCTELTRLIDSFMGDELLVETNHEVHAHLESCPDCRARMAERREFSIRLQRSLRTQNEAVIDTVFASKLSRELQDIATRPSLWQRTFSMVLRPAFIGSFAAVALLAIGSIVWMTIGGRDSVTASRVLASFTELAAIATGDHENCAVKFNLKEVPISLDEAAQKFGTYNKDLDKTVIAAIANGSGNKAIAGSEFLESHSCMFEGRRFAHVVVMKNDEMVSMLVTDTDLPLSNGELIAATGGSAAKSVGFVVGHHAVFFVSKLSESDNFAFAKSLAPAIRSHLEKLGA